MRNELKVSGGGANIASRAAGHGRETLGLAEVHTRGLQATRLTAAASPMSAAPTNTIAASSGKPRDGTATRCTATGACAAGSLSGCVACAGEPASSKKPAIAVDTRCSRITRPLDPTQITNLLRATMRHTEPNFKRCATQKRSRMRPESGCSGNKWKGDARFGQSRRQLP